MGQVATVVAVTRLMLEPSLRVRRDLASAAAIEAIGTGLAIAGPYALKLLIDRLGTTPPVTLAIFIILVAVIVLSLATTVTSALRSVHVQRVIDALHARLVARVLRYRLSMVGLVHPPAEAAPAGLLERLPYALQIVVDGLLWRSAPVVVQALLSLAVIGAVTPPRYVLLMAVALSAYGLATWLGAGRHRRHADAANAAVGRVSATLGDVLRNARRVAHNGAAAFELDVIGARLRARRTANEALAWSLARLSMLQFLAIGLGLSTLLLWGGIDVEAGRLSVGDFVLVQAMAVRLLLPLSGFGFIMSQAGSAIATIRDVLAEGHDVPAAVPDLPEAGPATIRIEGVSFAYPSGLSGLRDIALDLPPGGMTALAGPNGSGKSTLAQLIAGALEPQTGRVLIGGRDMAKVAPDWRHRHVLYVPQLTHPLNRSLGENGLYPPSSHGADDLTRLLAAWGFYGANETIDLDRLVGDQGEKLSGGQIQKLELARLTAVTVPVLILDESSSALDPAAEVRILADLAARMAGRTTLVVIGHRLHIASIAERVVYLDHGRVEAIGRHEVLMESHPGYRQLWAAAETMTGVVSVDAQR